MNGAHDELLREASRLKMLALRAEALGLAPTDWDVVKSYHAAARCHDRVVSTLSSEAAAKLQEATEACGLFLRARDPLSAFRLSETIQAILPLAGPYAPGEGIVGVARYEHARYQGLFEQLRQRLPNRMSFFGARTHDILSLLGEYPGVAALWFGLYRAGEHDQGWNVALDALEHALELNPDDARLAVLWLFVAPKTLGESALGPAETMWRRFASSPATTLMYATAMLASTRRRSDRRPFLERARSLISRAFELVGDSPWNLRPNAIALASYLDAKLSGQSDIDFASILSAAGMSVPDPRPRSEDEFTATMASAIRTELELAA